MFDVKKESYLNFENENTSLYFVFSCLPIGEDSGVEISKIRMIITDRNTGVIHDFSFEISAFERLRDSIDIRCEGFFNSHSKLFEIEYIVSIFDVIVFETTEEGIALALGTALNDFFSEKNI